MGGKGLGRSAGLQLRGLRLQRCGASASWMGRTLLRPLPSSRLRECIACRAREGGVHS